MRAGGLSRDDAISYAVPMHMWPMLVGGGEFVASLYTAVPALAGIVSPEEAAALFGPQLAQDEREIRERDAIFDVRDELVAEAAKDAPNVGKLTNDCLRLSRLIDEYRVRYPTPPC